MIMTNQAAELDRYLADLQQKISQGLVNEAFALQTLRDLARMRTTLSPEWHESPAVLKHMFQMFCQSAGSEHLQLPGVPFAELAAGEVFMPAVYLDASLDQAAGPRTFMAWVRLLSRMCRRQDMQFEVVAKPETLNSISMPKHRPGVRWGIFELGHQSIPAGRTMTALWPKLTETPLAGVEVLMALCYFPGILVEKWERIYLGACRFQESGREFILRLEKSMDGKAVYLQQTSSNSYMHDVIIPQFRPVE